MGAKKPAQVVREIFGTRALSRTLGITRDAVLKWGRSGLVPSKYHEKLLEEAKKKKLSLTAEMLICGA